MRLYPSRTPENSGSQHTKTSDHETPRISSSGIKLPNSPAPSKPRNLPPPPLTPFKLLPLLVIIVLVSTELQHMATSQSAGTWQTLQKPGVSAMHMALNRFDKIIVFDRTDYGPSQLPLPDGRCRYDSVDLALKTDCWAHSFEYDTLTGSFRPLEVMTDTWCSSGAFSPNGTLVSTGGYNDGTSAVRLFTPCSDDSCDWFEHPGNVLSESRWYASDQILPDGSIIVVGGRRAFSYDIIPPPDYAPLSSSTYFRFLVQTDSPTAENNLYPFLHLSSDGNLFVFASNQSILLNYTSGAVVRTFPTLPGGARCYPSSGSSVMLPLRHDDGFQGVEVIICGGSPVGAFEATADEVFMDALSDCGRMVITDQNPQWTMEEMPAARVMGDMIILPTGQILIINGAEQGTAGWGAAASPALSPFLYTPWLPAGSRFQVLPPSTIPRLYHSTAVFLPDGRILVGGSNTNVGYDFSGVPYPTELRLESFSPYYLNSTYDAWRPRITGVSDGADVRYGATFSVTFVVDGGGGVAADEVLVNVYAPPFTTHSYGMNQRMLYLGATVEAGGEGYVATAVAPPSGVAAPPGYYLLNVINNGVPSERAAWVRFS